MDDGRMDGWKGGWEKGNTLGWIDKTTNGPTNCNMGR